MYHKAPLTDYGVRHVQQDQARGGAFRDAEAGGGFGDGEERGHGTAPHSAPSHLNFCFPNMMTSNQ